MTVDEKTAKIKAVNEALDAAGEHALLLGGGEMGHPTEVFAEAILGIIWAPRVSVAYLRSKVVEAFVEQDEWTYEQAEEWYEYNTVRGLPYCSDEDNPPTLVGDVVS